MSGRGWWKQPLLWCCLLVCWHPLAALTVSEVPNPRKADGGWVTDEANVIDSATRARINQTIDALKAASGAEIAVVTVKDTSGEDTKQFATDLFNTWHIGKAGENSGVLVLLNMGERRIEIETGYGAEAVLTDAEVGRILDTRVIPKFKSGDFGQGLAAGVDAVAARLGQSSDFTPGEATVGATGTAATDERQPGRGAPLGLGIFALVIGGLVVAAKRRAIPVCAKCQVKMVHLDEKEEDAFLSADQQLEESVGGVDYDVWQCPKCSDVTVRQQVRNSAITACPKCALRTLKAQTSGHDRREQVCLNPQCDFHRHQRLLSEQEEDRYLEQVQQLEERLGGKDYKVWLSEETDEVTVESVDKFSLRVEDCPQCNRRTLQHSERVIRSATRRHDGLSRTEYHCANPACRYRRTEDHVIARIVETTYSSGSPGWSSSGSSFSSSSSSSSFGGGSSGGGGAGRSF